MLDEPASLAAGEPFFLRGFLYSRVTCTAAGQLWKRINRRRNRE